MQSVRRTAGPSLRLILGLVLAGVFIFVLAQGGVGRVIGWVGQPFAAVGTWITQSVSRQSPTEIEQERDQLREQLLAVSQRLTETQRQLDTAETVAKLEAFVTEGAYQAVMAYVIAYSPDPGIQSVVIQRGQLDGVENGQAVVTDTGVLVGVVAQSDSTTATVRLITDSQSRVLAKIQNQPESRGIVSGERGLSTLMNFIPRNDEVLLGQGIVTSGLDTNIPPDIFIGTIESTSARPGELFQTAIVNTPIEFQRLNAVAVIQSRL